MSVAASLAAGIAVGWIIRGLLDRALLTICIRILQTAIGKEKLAAALAKVAAGTAE